jgi:hypothetical protein
MYISVHMYHRIHTSEQDSSATMQDDSIAAPATSYLFEPHEEWIERKSPTVALKNTQLSARPGFGLVRPV